MEEKNNGALDLVVCACVCVCRMKKLQRQFSSVVLRVSELRIYIIYTHTHDVHRNFNISASYVIYV